MSKFIFSPGLWFTLILILFFWRHKFWTNRLKRVYVICSLFLFYLSTTPFLFYSVAFSWERNFEVFDCTKLPKNTRAKIVVLGSGYSHDQTLPRAALLGPSALSRLVEAVRIAHLFPNSILHTSGYSATGKTPGAIYLKDAAIELGIGAERISMQPEPKNTKSEAEVFAKSHYKKIDTVILVTSAIHIPRAQKHFTDAGVQNLFVTPADYLTFTDNTYSWYNFLPSLSYWNKYERLTKEIVGYHLTL